ncbi:MAG: zinc-ribbon domain-containing protein [Syntrophobacteraceae bacterium]
MKVQCPGCRIAFTIPDEKIPGGRTLKIPCPKCKIPIEINAKPPEAVSPDEARGGLPPMPDLSDYASAIDVVEHGVKTALLCVSNTRLADRIAMTLQELDFWVVHAARSGFALGKLHHNSYDLIVLEENFDSAKATDNLVLHHVQLLPMHVRRQFYLCLLSEALPTLDAMMAFRMGVNLILNVADLEKAKIILARTMKEYKTFYGFFNSELNRKLA